MKPTKFLKENYRRSLHDRGITVKYYPFLQDDTIVDPLTKEPNDEGLAYGDPIEIKALVNHNPSPHARQSFGLEENIDLILEVCTEDVLDAGIVFHSGDKFEFGDREYDVLSSKRGKQVSEQHISYKLACQYHAGRSGDSE
jgi:hypothetical protein